VKVVYGDTDSLFVHLEGRTKEQAFAVCRGLEGV
jgi:DNA polymerase elongation subunit (family B)